LLMSFFEMQLHEKRKVHLNKPSFFMKNQASFVPQGYHFHVKSKLLSVRVPVKQIAKARIKK
jgi:hypothetical protein